MSSELPATRRAQKRRTESTAVGLVYLPAESAEDPPLTDGCVTSYTAGRNMRLTLWNSVIVAASARIGRWLRASGCLG